jgi:microcystin-dependent protein
MAEVVHDLKLTTLELTTDSGLNFSGNNPRIKHTGTGTFTVQSVVGKINISSGSGADDSLNFDSAGGIDVDGAGEISIETTDTVDGIKIAETEDVPVDIGAGGGTFLLGKSGEAATFRGSLVVSGDLTVNGDTVSHNVIVNETEDPVLRLNKNVAGSSAVDIGFVGDRGTSTNIGFIWDESHEEFATVMITDDSQLALVGNPQHTLFDDYANLHSGTGTFDDSLYVAGSRFTVAEGSGNTVVNQGTFTTTSTTNSANAIRLNTNGGTSETIVITNTQGTSESAITLTSTAGGVDVDASALKDVNIAGGQVIVSSKDNVASAISLTTNVGTTETIVVKNTQGTSVNSINLVSDAGGITMTVNNNSAITIENDSTVGINTSNPDNTYDLHVNGTTNTTGLYQNGSLLVPPGCVMPYAAGSAPGGWLLCDGSSYSRTTYASLFAVIGVQYGAVDGSHFSVPDMRGRFVIGFKSTDTSFDALGETGGSKTATLTTTELPAHTHTGTTNSDGSHTHTGTTNSDGSHTHTITDPGHSHSLSSDEDVESGGGATVANRDQGTGEFTGTNTTGITINSGGAHTHSFTTNSGGSHTHGFTTDSTGSGSAFSIMNPYITLNYIIKV